MDQKPSDQDEKSWKKVSGIIRFLDYVLIVIIIGIFLDMLHITYSNFVPESNIEGWNTHINIKHTGALEWNETETSRFSFDKVEGTFNIVNAPFSLKLVITIQELFRLSLILIIVLLLRKIFKTIMSENPFHTINFNRLRLIGFTVMLFDIHEYLLNFVTSVFIRPKIIMNNAIVSQYIGFELDSILFGLLVLAIAEIFKIGAHMKKEQELTI